MGLFSSQKNKYRDLQVGLVSSLAVAYKEIDIDKREAVKGPILSGIYYHLSNQKEVPLKDAADIWQMAKLLFLDASFDPMSEKYANFEKYNGEIPTEYFDFLKRNLPSPVYLILAPVIQNLMEEFLMQLPSEKIDFERLSNGSKRTLSSVLQNSVKLMNSDLVANHTGDVSEAVLHMALATSRILQIARATLPEY